jgi:hypothetical protein
LEYDTKINTSEIILSYSNYHSPEKSDTITYWRVEGSYIIPVFITFWHKTNITQNYISNNNNLKNNMINLTAQRTKLSLIMEQEFTIQIQPFTNGSFHQHNKITWIKDYQSYILNLPGSIIGDPNYIYKSIEGGVITLPSGLTLNNNMFTAYGYAYYGETTYFIRKGVSNIGVVNDYGGYVYSSFLY